MTVHYRVRKGFRVAAAVPALILTPVGLLFLALGLLNAFSGEPFAILALVLGVVSLGLGPVCTNRMDRANPCRRRRVWAG